MVTNSYLTSTEYNMVIKNLSRFAKDNKLKNATPLKSSLISGLYAFTGGFSCVYKINIENKKKALRCWHRYPGKVQKRFPIVSEYLINKTTPYFVDIQYIPDAMNYNNKSIAVSLMDWIEGDTLSKFLEKNILNQKLLILVSNEFMKMVKSLHELKISHGDLQTENIMICEVGDKLELRLIDYDSLYVPSIPENFLDDLVGLPAFQHPRRAELVNNKSNYYKADYFSELVIYLSLLSYAYHPNLWDGSKEKLLFESGDFQKPDKSKIISTLLVSNNSKIVFLANKLKEFCKLSPNNLLPLENILSQSPKLEPINNNENSFDDFFKSSEPSKAKIKQNPRNIKDSSFDVIFDNSISADINVLICPKGHKAPSPNSADPYCPFCNDINYFFGQSQVCKNCKKSIPKRLINSCPHCGIKI